MKLHSRIWLFLLAAALLGLLALRFTPHPSAAVKASPAHKARLLAPGERAADVSCWEVMQ